MSEPTRKTFTIPSAEIRAMLEANAKERKRLQRALKFSLEEEEAHGVAPAPAYAAVTLPAVNGTAEAAPTDGALDALHMPHKAKVRP